MNPLIFAMVDVRAIEAQLTRDVEQQVLQDLGYAEWSVTLPGATSPITPRPQVKQLDPKAMARIAPVMHDGSGPGYDVAWEIKIPRTTSASAVQAYGLWRLEFAGNPGVYIFARPINITPENAIWKVYVGNVNEDWN